MVSCTIEVNMTKIAEPIALPQADNAGFRGITVPSMKPQCLPIKFCLIYEIWAVLWEKFLDHEISPLGNIMLGMMPIRLSLLFCMTYETYAN